MLNVVSAYINRNKLLKRFGLLNFGLDLSGAWGAQFVGAERKNNCRVTWAGRFKEKHMKRTIVLELVAEGDIWIWSCHLCERGSLNDIITLDSSFTITSIFEINLAPEFQYNTIYVV